MKLRCFDLDSTHLQPEAAAKAPDSLGVSVVVKTAEERGFKSQKEGLERFRICAEWNSSTTPEALVDALGTLLGMGAGASESELSLRGEQFKAGSTTRRSGQRDAGEVV